MPIRPPLNPLKHRPKTAIKTGFTLVEFLIVIVISGIIAGMIGFFILRPIQGYDTQARRGTLSEQAEMALRRIQRDVRRALPNSVRILCDGNLPPCAGTETRWALEMITAKAGARYRVGPGNGPSNPGPPPLASALCRLNLSTPDASFSIISALGLTAFAASDRIVISNWSARNATANAYAGDNITPTGTTLSLTVADATCEGEDRVALSSGFRFPFASSRQRLFIVENEDNPVTYLCDTNASARNITRYHGYNFTLNQTLVDTAAELIAAGASDADENSLLTGQVSNCNFQYQPGTSQRSGIVILDMTLQDADSGEQVRLLHQVHIDNVS